MWCIIYENKTSNTVVLEYVFSSNYEKRRHFLDCQDDIVIYWHGLSKENPIKAFWRCLIKYRKVEKINI